MIKASQLLAHRGNWANDLGEECFKKNSVEAFESALSLGFGLETDLRDYRGSLVISHDVAHSLSPKVDFQFLQRFEGPVAINIKSDGLTDLLTSNFAAKFQSDVFCFDMTIPELIRYQSLGIPVAKRMSEFEDYPKISAGWIWLDSFVSEWYLDNLVEIACVSPDTKVALVSPELHGRPYLSVWPKIAKAMSRLPNLYLCTDYPTMFLKQYQDIDV